MSTGEDSALHVPPPPAVELAEPWSVREPRREADVELVQRWMARPHVAEFWCQNWPLDRWRDEIATQLAGDHSRPLLVARGGRDLAYLEVYRVVRDRLAGCYRNDPHDIGLHIAIGERESTGRGTGRELLTDVAAAALVADPRCGRVVAEPDSGNAASVAAFRAAGFTAEGEVTLPDKTATLMVRARDTST